jgi:hypothetical protein
MARHSAGVQAPQHLLPQQLSPDLAEKRNQSGRPRVFSSAPHRTGLPCETPLYQYLARIFQVDLLSGEKSVIRTRYNSKGFTYVIGGNIGVNAMQKPW